MISCWPSAATASPTTTMRSGPPPRTRACPCASTSTSSAAAARAAHAQARGEGRRAAPALRRDGKAEGQRQGGAGLAGVFSTVPITVGQLIFTGVFERFPNLHIPLIETGVGWMPHFLEQMDDRYWRNRSWGNIPIERAAVLLLVPNMSATFVRDDNGFANRHEVGVDNMMWSTDYPHHGNDWPYSRKVDQRHDGRAARATERHARSSPATPSHLRARARSRARRQHEHRRPDPRVRRRPRGRAARHVRRPPARRSTRTWRRKPSRRTTATTSGRSRAGAAEHRPERRGRQAAGGVRHRPDVLRRDAPRLLRHRRARPRHERQRRARLDVLPVVPRLLRPALQPHRGQGRRPGDAAGLQRLAHRRVVRHRTRVGSSRCRCPRSGTPS